MYYSTPESTSKTYVQALGKNQKAKQEIHGTKSRYCLYPLFFLPSVIVNPWEYFKIKSSTLLIPRLASRRPNRPFLTFVRSSKICLQHLKVLPEAYLKLLSVIFWSLFSASLSNSNDKLKLSSPKSSQDTNPNRQTTLSPTFVMSFKTNL